MFFTLGISLYTSRVILQVLGVQDYGIYSVVGGVVSLFGFFNGAMASSTQRFLSFDIGKNDTSQLKKTFNATVNIHLFIAIIALLLLETIGVWFVNTQLNIQEERIFAVNVVYQFSIFTFLIGVVQVPYDALIIAREKMNIYAITSIVEVSLKLLILFLLQLFEYDYLILYTAFLFLSSLIIKIWIRVYCKLKFNESKYSFYYDKSFYRILLSYSGWNLFGSLASIAKGQGINVLLNLFFGTVINAAYGIALQVQGAVSMFVNNFQTAINPQIIKTYAKGDLQRSHSLILQSAKFSFFLMFVLFCPIFFNIDFILKLWLVNPPDFTRVFVILSLVNLLIDCISGPLMTGLQATGKIKVYQFTVGMLLVLNLPISYMFLKIDSQPEFVFFVSIAISIIALFSRVYFLAKQINLNVKEFFVKVFIPIFKLLIITALLVNLTDYFQLPTLTWTQFIIKNFSLVLIIVFFMIIVGITKQEKHFILQLVKNRLKRSE